MERSLNTFNKELENRILSIDPSGTGTTGIYFKNGVQEEFKEYKDKSWQKHYDFISSLVKERSPNILLYETSNYVRLRGKDMTSLFKLLGSLEMMEIKEVKSIPVDQVKRLTKELLSGSKKIEGLEYKKGRGKGWMYKSKRVSIHCLEAFIVYYNSR